MIRVSKVKKLLIWIVGVFSLLPVFSFKARMFSWIALLLYIFTEIFFDDKKSFRIDPLFVGMFIFGLISTIFCQMSEMGNSWKTNAINCYKNFAIITLFYVLNGKNKISKDILSAFINGLKISCIIQIVWSYLQFIVFKIIGVNITEFVFKDILGIISTDTIFYTTKRMSVTGLAWHPCQLVPLVVIAYCMFDKKIIRAFVIGVAIISSNSSNLIAIMCCIGVDVLINTVKGKIKLKSVLSFLFIMFFLFVVLFTNRGLSELVLERFSTTIARVGDVFNKSGTYVSNSTYLHIRYYLSYPKIAKYLGPLKTIFGIGFDNAGYPYSKVLGQYTNLNVWTTESDVMNILIGRGWIYFILFYMWLIKIAAKGYKLSKFYTIMIVSLIVAGIGYNNQFEWLIIIECFMCYAVDSKVDIFGLMNNHSFILKLKKKRKLRNMLIKEDNVLL